MPCHDGGVPYPKSEQEVLDEKAPAMLCAIIRAMQPELRMQILQNVDWKKAGVELGEYVRWQKLHDALDLQREANEERRRKMTATRKAALAKLSPEERAALGVK